MLRQVMLTRLSPVVAPSWLVGQSRQTPLLKPLHPLVDKTPADPDRGGNVGNRHSIGDE